jgi:thiamine kinase-like enzyme
MFKSLIICCLQFAICLILPLKGFCNLDLEHLKAHFQTTQNLTVTKLHGGATGARNYKIKDGQKEYVLRILNPAECLEVRQSEIAAAIFAGEKGIGPRVVYTSSGYDAMIMEFLSGHTVFFSMDQREKMRVVLTTIRALHESTGTFPRGKTVFERIRVQLHEILSGTRGAPQKKIKEALEKLTSLERLFKNETLVPCHQDLNGLNIIENGGEAKLIDWTNAGQSYAIYDLGYFALLNGIHEADHFEFLSLYFGRSPSIAELKLLKAAKQVATLSLFSSLFHDHEPSIADQDERKKRQLELEERLKSHAFLSLADYIDLHRQGQIHHVETLIDVALAALEEF